MNYYMILLIFMMMLSLILLLSQKMFKIRQNKKYLILIFTILVLFLVLRDPSVGVDTDNYKEIFKYCHKVDFIRLFSFSRHEVGFKYYCKLISSIYYDYTFFLMITSILSMIGVYYFIQNNSKNYIQSTFIFITFNFYSYFFGILRQSLAISILLFSLTFIKKRKLFPFLLFVFLASLFHKTALVFLPLYFVYQVKIDKLKFWIWLIFIILFVIFKNFILDFIFNYIYKPNSLEALSGSGYKMLVLLLGISLLSYFYQDKLLKKDRNNQLFINMTFIATLIQVLATMFSTAHRITLYYLFGIIILIPNIIRAIENEKVRIIVIISMYLFLTVYFYYMTTSSSIYVDYHFIFE